LENYRIIPHFWSVFSVEKSGALILTKNDLGYILGKISQTHLVTLQL
jgi:hypothetical protein